MSIVFSLIGGLGFFLYGMKMMSDGLEKAAGAKMRRILEMFTKNRILGILVGTVFTAVIQSSSATTVMVVSFVNAGLMSLTNAAGVILGANIGTTVTSQLIAFNLSEVAPLFVMAGVIMLMFCKNNNIQKIGEVILGFGVYTEVLANVVMLPGEGFVKSVCTVFHTDFGLTKVCFDAGMTICAALISLVLFSSLNGVREGTIIAALAVGLIARFFGKRLAFLKPLLFPASQAG